VEIGLMVRIVTVERAVRGARGAAFVRRAA
jgi:hypothetical protein